MPGVNFDLASLSFQVPRWGFARSTSSSRQRALPASIRSVLAFMLPPGCVKRISSRSEHGILEPRRLFPQPDARVNELADYARQSSATSVSRRSSAKRSMRLENHPVNRERNSGQASRNTVAIQKLAVVPRQPERCDSHATTKSCTPRLISTVICAARCRPNFE